MAYPRRLQIHMNIDIPLDVADALAVFCKQRKVTKKSIVELALRRFLDKETAGDGGNVRDNNNSQ